jgi:hypothetical protein
MENYENLGFILYIYMTLAVAQTVAKTSIDFLPNW